MTEFQRHMAHDSVTAVTFQELQGALGAQERWCGRQLGPVRRLRVTLSKIRSKNGLPGRAKRAIIKGQPRKAGEVWTTTNPKKPPIPRNASSSPPWRGLPSRKGGLCRLPKKMWLRPRRQRVRRRRERLRSLLPPEVLQDLRRRPATRR